MKIKIEPFKVENPNSDVYGKFYVVRELGHNVYEYLHRDGTWHNVAGDPAAYDVERFVPESTRPTESDAEQALETLFRYYSQPALDIPIEKMKLLNKNFADVLERK